MIWPSSCVTTWMRAIVNVWSKSIQTCSTTMILTTNELGARLLGRDIATVMSPETRKVVLEILDRETDNQKRYRLVEDMMDNYAVSGDAFEECLQILESPQSGDSGGLESV